MSNRFSESASKGVNTTASEDTEEAAQAALGDKGVEEAQLNVKLPKALRDAFKQKCKSEGRTMSWVVKQAIRDYISKDK